MAINFEIVDQQEKEQPKPMKASLVKDHNGYLGFILNGVKVLRINNDNGSLVRICLPVELRNKLPGIIFNALGEIRQPGETEL